jgi:hypothetical protein
MNRAKGPSNLGPVYSAAVYPLDVFRSLTGLDAWALRTARRNGLKIRRCGRRGYVIGDEWISYLRSLDQDKACAAMRDR